MALCPPVMMLMIYTEILMKLPLMIVTVSGITVQCHVGTKVNVEGFQSKIG